MLTRRWVVALAAAVIIMGVLGPSEAASARERLELAFDRVRRVQEHYTHKMMARQGIVGTAVGLDEKGDPSVLVLLESKQVSDIPKDLEGVPVQPIITGKIYALTMSRPPGPELSAVRHLTPPAAPLGLTAEALSSSQIHLRWIANREIDMDRYEVYRAARSIGPYARIASVPHESSPAYTDGGLRPGTAFYYVVTAVDRAANQSRRSNIAGTITPLETQEAPIGSRPAPLGVSTGHPHTTAGTIGCRVYKEVAGVREYYALSNNHVYANEDEATLGDSILQPGPYDNGRDPRDRIGVLADFQEIVFSRNAANQIDAALALCAPETLGNSAPGGSFTPSRTPAAATVGLAVKKHGRTTGLTHGYVYAVNASVDVTYDSGTARFVRQIVITPATFSAGGNSGSLIVTADGNHPVGLLFTGGDTFTIANPIDLVLSRFGVAIDGK